MCLCWSISKSNHLFVRQGNTSLLSLRFWNVRRWLRYLLSNRIFDVVGGRKSSTPPPPCCRFNTWNSAALPFPFPRLLIDSNIVFAAMHQRFTRVRLRVEHQVEQALNWVLLTPRLFEHMIRQPCVYRKEDMLKWMYVVSPLRYWGRGRIQGTSSQYAPIVRRQAALHERGGQRSNE